MYLNVLSISSGYISISCDPTYMDLALWGRRTPVTTRPTLVWNVFWIQNLVVRSYWYQGFKAKYLVLFIIRDFKWISLMWNLLVSFLIRGYGYVFWNWEQLMILFRHLSMELSLVCYHDWTYFRHNYCWK